MVMMNPVGLQLGFTWPWLDDQLVSTVWFKMAYLCCRQPIALLIAPNSWDPTFISFHQSANDLKVFEPSGSGILLVLFLLFAA